MRPTCTSVTHKVHAVLGQPVEALEEEQQREEGHEARGEVVPEHGEGQAGLRHGVPRALNQVLGGERGRGGERGGQGTRGGARGGQGKRGEVRGREGRGQGERSGGGSERMITVISPPNCFGIIILQCKCYHLV